MPDLRRRRRALTKTSSGRRARGRPVADSDGRIGGAQRNVRRTITPRDDVGELVKLPQTPLDLPVAQRLEVGQSGVDDVNKGAADRPAALGAAPVPAVKGTLSLQLARLGTTST